MRRGPGVTVKGDTSGKKTRRTEEVHRQGPTCGGTPWEMELVKGGDRPFPFVGAMLACCWIVSGQDSCRRSLVVKTPTQFSQEECLKHKDKTQNRD